jgi:hypothetical protein
LDDPVDGYLGHPQVSSLTRRDICQGVPRTAVPEMSVMHGLDDRAAAQLSVSLVSTALYVSGVAGHLDDKYTER